MSSGEHVGAASARSLGVGRDCEPWYLALIDPQSCRYSGHLACRAMSTVLRILGESLSESMEFVTPLSSPVHRGLQDTFEDQLDTSEDTVGQEVSGDADESLDVTWEGSKDERRAWLRGSTHKRVWVQVDRGGSSWVWPKPVKQIAWGET